MIEAASPEAVTAVASTWLGVRLVLPYLRAVPWVKDFLVGQRVWALVFISAVGVAYLEATATGSSYAAQDLLRSAGAISVAAIGTDRIIKGSDSAS